MKTRPPKLTLKGQVDLRDCVVAPAEGETNKMFTFAIWSLNNEQRTHYFEASDDETRKQWVKVLNDKINSLSAAHQNPVVGGKQ